MKIFRIIAAAALLAFSLPAAAQFSNAHPDGVKMPSIAEVTKDRVGGPVAIGQTMAQIDPSSNKVAIIQAPAVPVEQSGGGIINLSAFGWLAPYVDSALQALIVAGFGLLGKSKYSQWLDQSSRDALQIFVKNRASSLIADGAVRMQDKSVRVNNSMLFHAAAESATAIPDALKRFGLTPAVVAAKIIDAIPQTPAGAAIVAAAHAEDPAAAPVPVAPADRPSAAPQVATPNNQSNPPTVGA